MVMHIKMRVIKPINAPDGIKKAITAIIPERADEKICSLRLKNVPDRIDVISSRIYVVMLLIKNKISI